MRPRKTLRRRIIYGIAAVVVILLMFVIRPLLSPKEKPIIRTAKVERGTVTSSVSANGILQPLTTVEVKSNVGGQVVNLAVDEGDTVKAGQLIAEIDLTDTLTAYEQSQADLAASLSRVDQSRQQLAMQRTQSLTGVESARQNLAAAQARLQQAQEQASAQPKLTSAVISQAKSSLASAEASLRQTRSALVPQKLASAQASFDQANAAHVKAQQDLSRQKELFNRGFVAKSQVDAAEESSAVAKAQLDSAKSRLDTVKDETAQDLSAAQARVAQARAELENATANSVQVRIRQQELRSAQAAVKQSEAALQSAIAETRQDRVRQGDIVQSQAQVERSQAALRSARQQLDYTTIVAPRDGVVTKKYVEAGSIVTAGRASFSGTGSGVSLVDIADVSRMFALVSVDETDIAQIEVGQEVDVTVEAYPDELFTGKVTKIAPQSVTEQNVTTIPVTVEIEIPDARLKPGMSVTCDFITGRASDVLLVPNEAVREDDRGATVTVMNSGKQVTRGVEIGLIGGDNTEIISGLKEGDTVVTAIIEPGDASGGSRTGGFGPGGFGGPGGGRMRGMR